VVWALTAAKKEKNFSELLGKLEALDEEQSALDSIINTHLKARIS